MKCWKTRNYCFHDNVSKNIIKLKKYYEEKFSETTGIEIRSQHWNGNRKLLMEGIDVEYFLIKYPTSNESSSIFIHI